MSLENFADACIYGLIMYVVILHQAVAAFLVRLLP